MGEITLRQVEVIRAVMLRGTINGAAEYLRVSAPGVSRLVRHTETMLNVRLFERRAGLFVPAPEARAIFDQIRAVYREVENLQAALSALQGGVDVRLAFASSPSVAQVIAARVVGRIRQRFPGLYIDVNILKIEETLDYVLLERGEFVIMSSPLDTPGVENAPIAEAPLVAIVPEGHALAERETVSVADLARERLIGIDPDDPFGEILARPFREAGIHVRHDIRARFAQTVVSLVSQGLGVAVIDALSVAEPSLPGLVRRPLAEGGTVRIFAITKTGCNLSSFAEYAIGHFRHELGHRLTDATAVNDD